IATMASALALLVTLLVLFALVRVALFYSLYSWLFRHVVEATGQDLWISRAIALGVVAAFWLFSWRVLLLPWIGHARRQAAILIGIAGLAMAGMSLVTRDVY